jgi:hypothetical protein
VQRHSFSIPTAELLAMNESDIHGEEALPIDVAEVC